MIGKRIAGHWWLAGTVLCGVLGPSAGVAAQPPVVTRSYTEMIVWPTASYTPAELQFATEELKSARLALDTGEYERARRLAEQADADAQLAELHAQSTSTRLTAHELQLSSEALRDAAIRASTMAVYRAPLAPLDLRLATEELESARLALDTGEYERARRLADQAAADAQMAEVRAGTESTRLAAQDLRVRIDTLRAEARRLTALF